MRVVVYGLWHLGSVTAACLAAAGHDVIGLDPDAHVIASLAKGCPPIDEPGLASLVGDGLASGRLRFTTDANEALPAADVLWVTFDTPVNDRDEADVAFVRARLEEIAGALGPGTLVLASSQVPVGFTRALAHDWRHRRLRFAYSPENLRLGKAIEAFRTQERVIVGVESDGDRDVLAPLFQPFATSIEWMSIESAEMTKHALNAFLATSVTFINEIARLCEVTGADAKQVERGLKSEGRIGKRAYLAPGNAFAGGTLARDVRYLVGFGHEHHRPTPLFDGVLASNERQLHWLREKVLELVGGADQAVVALLGLTYTPGTSTLRRSAAVDLASWLRGRGVTVRAFDPAIHALPPELRSTIELSGDALGALAGADVAVIATKWPEFKALTPDTVVKTMRHARLIDQSWFLAQTLSSDPRIQYIATGKSSVR